MDGLKSLVAACLSYSELTCCGQLDDDIELLNSCDKT